MTIHELVSMAKRIHDTEGWKLGSASTRETRNEFWARVIGCAHHGHPLYNPTPDPQWHLKDGGGGRPQTDDVATSMPSREFWDCIGGVGADGYTFGASASHGALPPEQNVYPPPRPDQGGAEPEPQPPVVGDLWTTSHVDIRARLGASATTQTIAEQLAFTFPEQGWGLKRADRSRPISADVIGRMLGGRLVGVRVIPAPGGAVLDIADQVFVPVVGVNHLGTAPPPVEPPPVIPPPTVPPPVVVPPAVDYSERFNQIDTVLANVLTVMRDLRAETTQQREEVLDAVRGQSYDFKAKLPIGTATGVITPRGQA